MKKLKEYSDIAARGLYNRYRFQCTAIAKEFPLLMSGMWHESENLKPTDTIETVIKYGTLQIGFIGLAECLTALTGKHHGESEESQKLGIEIIKELYNMVEGYSNQYNLNYTLVATSAEKLVGKLIKIDQKEYGNIPGVTDRAYYTNSSHVPVWYECTMEEKAKIEAPYQEFTRGGHIFYVETTAEIENHPETIQYLVDLMEKYNIGYATINFPKSKCTKCGFEIAKVGVRHCSVCDSEEVEIIQRITGYLVGSTSRWNQSKLAELRDRTINKKDSD